MSKSNKRTSSKRKRTERQVPTLEDYVRKLPKDRLIEIVLDQVGDNESLERELLDEILERFGKPSDLIKDARKVVESATNARLKVDRRGYAEPVDYWPVRSAFERLLKEKQYDMLIEFGPTIAKRSQYQIELSASDSEPHYSVSECIGYVMQALIKSDLLKPDKIVYAVRLVIEDGYCACEKAEELLHRRWAKRDWKQAAEILRKLTSEYPEDGYPRERLDRWIATAEENGG